MVASTTSEHPGAPERARQPLDRLACIIAEHGGSQATPGKRPPTAPNAAQRRGRRNADFPWCCLERVGARSRRRRPHNPKVAVPAAPAVDVPGQRPSVTDHVAMSEAHGRGDHRQMLLMSASLPPAHRWVTIVRVSSRLSTRCNSTMRVRFFHCSGLSSSVPHRGDQWNSSSKASSRSGASGISSPVQSFVQ
jgi:hypothetical protein